MTIILFLIDTSGSMNQRTHFGARPTLLDVTKETVEKFIKMRQRDSAARGDRYMLLTFDDVPFNIKAGWKESHAAFMNELKNLTANGMTTFGPALRNAFDYLNINRMQTGIDFYGTGRYPYFLEMAIIIAITDGARYTTCTNVQRELFLPVTTNCPGSEFTNEPFRWDQRLFSIVLRLSGTYTADPPITNGTTNYVVPCDESSINDMCEVTGGRSFCVTSQRALTASLEQLISRLNIGVMMKFEKVGPDPPMIIPNEDVTEVNNQRNWFSTRSLILVHSGMKGYSVGHWPIPEAYWPDLAIQSFPPRSAHPVIKFTCTNSDPAVIDNLPFDKYELDPSPLTQYILSRKQPNIAWQVYISNSQRNSELGQPFGYLKASTNLTCVNLFVLPYNYPVLLPMLDELLKIHQGKPTREWRQQFESYIKSIPIYYASPLRRAMQRMGANSALVPESLDTYSSVTVQNLIRRYKGLAKNEFEKLASAVGTQKAIGIEWPRISSTSLFASNYNNNRKSNIVDYCTNPSLRNAFYGLQTEIPDFSGFVVRYKEKLNSRSKVQCYRNAFDISRDDLVDQAYKFRRNFFQKQTSLIKYQDEDQIHSLPVSQMGNYQEYLKRMPIPLRELEALPTRQHMFGNPFKLERKNVMMIDEADFEMTVGNNGSGNGSKQSSKRSLPDTFAKGGSMAKRKPGPLPRDFQYRPSPLRSPMPSPPQSPSQSAMYTPPSSPSIHLSSPQPFSPNSMVSYSSQTSPNHYSPNNVQPPPNMKPQNGLQYNKPPTQVNVKPSQSIPPGTFGSMPSNVVVTRIMPNNIIINDVSNNNNNSMNTSSLDLHKLNRQQHPSIMIGSHPLHHLNKKSAQLNQILNANGAIPIGKPVNTSQFENSGEDLSIYLLNFFRRKNFSIDECEKKFQALALVRKQSQDYSELIQYLSSIDDGSFAHYLLLEVVLEAIRFKKKFVIHSLRSSSQFGTKIEKILYVNSLNEDGQKVGR